LVDHNLTRIISGPADNTDAHNLMMEIAYDVRGNAIGSTLTGHRRNLAADEPFTRLVMRSRKKKRIN